MGYLPHRIEPVFVTFVRMWFTWSAIALKQISRHRLRADFRPRWSAWKGEMSKRGHVRM